MPNADRAFVAPEKMTRYLLAPENPQNRGKAAFFSHFGFAREQGDMLAAALAEHVRTHPVEQIIPEPGRTKYTVVGPLRTPDGTSPTVRTVWQIDDSESAPRFITAYPQEGRSRQ